MLALEVARRVPRNRVHPEPRLLGAFLAGIAHWLLLAAGAPLATLMAGRGARSSPAVVNGRTEPSFEERIPPFSGQSLS